MRKSGATPKFLNNGSPDGERERTWLRLKGNNNARRLRRVKSVTDVDLEELKACIELGFGFGPDSPELNPKLSDTLPALGLYWAVERQYSKSLSRYSSHSSIYSDGDNGSTSSIFDQDDAPETVKTKLRQWAKVVACSVRQLSRS